MPSTEVNTPAHPCTGTVSPCPGSHCLSAQRSGVDITERLSALGLLLPHSAGPPALALSPSLLLLPHGTCLLPTRPHSSECVLASAPSFCAGSFGRLTSHLQKEKTTCWDQLVISARRAHVGYSSHISPDLDKPHGTAFQLGAARTPAFAVPRMVACV